MSALVEVSAAVEVLVVVDLDGGVVAMTSQAVPRLTRAESRAQTRQRIVDSAMRVFARHGYAGASVNAIAEQAGYTVGALYSNFATKDEVFWAAFEQYCASELAALDAVTAEARDVDELLGAITGRFTDLDERHREWWALWADLWLYGQRHPDGARWLADVQAQTRAAITGAFAHAGHHPAEETVAVVHALWTGFMLYRLTDPDALGPAAFGRADTVLTGTAAHPAGGHS
jgi:AcrR family transcriptional regulator